MGKFSAALWRTETFGVSMSAHLLVRIDPNWDYDRQRLVPPELSDQVNDNLEKQFKHGERIFEFFRAGRHKYPVSLHFIGQRAADSLFYVKRIEANP